MSKAAILFNLNLGVALSEALNSELWITPYITLRYTILCVHGTNLSRGRFVSIWGWEGGVGDGR